MSAKKRLSGTALAVAAAGFASFAVMSAVSTSVVADEAAATEAKVHCFGVNSCKGHNDCSGENNSCKGMGSCKGTGFLSMTAAECTEKGGEVK